MGPCRILPDKQRMQSTDGPKLQNTSHQLWSCVQLTGCQTYNRWNKRDVNFNIKSFKGFLQVYDLKLYRIQLADHSSKCNLPCDRLFFNSKLDNYLRKNLQITQKSYDSVSVVAYKFNIRIQPFWRWVMQGWN